jgi:hypothetical protein
VPDMVVEDQKSTPDQAKRCSGSLKFSVPERRRFAP